ncbi:FkbM family methyltransferase [Aggregatibacter kilianii]|uniref:FkbM family methyltransferase n=1 Tax=Aggregatibacter kilianii TaxID=2025884 RepID=UPI000D656BA8|nr:FkbM family methyltransferase [Aggregatibacter kilianii]
MTNEPLCDIYPVDNVRYLLSTRGPDYITERLRRGETWEKFLLTISQFLIEGIENPVLFDIGANLGAWTIPMGKYIQPRHGKIFAFEPQRPVFYQLCGNLFLNNLMHCHAYNMALGNKRETIRIPLLDVHRSINVGAFSISDEINQQLASCGWTQEYSEYQEVECNTLNSLFADWPDEKVHLIKIDVEGWELEVLQGAKRFLRNSGFPPLLFEVWGEQMPKMLPKRAQLLAFVESLGYDYVLSNELCIAQHRENKLIEVKTEGEMVYFSRLVKG